MQHRNSAAPGILYLWYSKISESTLAAEDAVIRMLSISEQGRLNSIGSKTRRREYLLSRALMRHALSQRFMRQDPEWLVEDRPESPPVVSNLPADTHISLSHSNGCICFAIAASPLGIDIEAADRKRDFGALAEAFMNDEELAFLAARKLGQADYFYRVWSAKEACYKSLSAAQQSITPLSKIRYSELVANNACGYLCEGIIDGFSFAAMLACKPDEISCNHFLSAGETLKPVEAITLDL